MPRCGCITLSVPRLSPRRTILCSEVCDPFLNFVDWLNAIADGRSAIWRVGEEGSDSSFIYLAAQWLGDGSAQLLYSWGAADAVRQLTGCIVDTRSVVAGFRAAFNAMITDPDYEEYQWEHPVGARDDLADEAVDRSFTTNPYSGARLRELDWSRIDTFLSTTALSAET